MSAHTSPTKFNDNEDAFMSDINFKADINNKMRVPTKISMEHYDGEVQNGVNTWSNYYQNMNMHVPERILVAGQDQHIGTRAPPREMVLDNSILPAEPENIRIHTPPRVITLDKYHFPMVDEKEDTPKEVIPVVKPRSKFNISDNETRLLHREATPPIGAGGEGLTASEEVIHLRRQMAKLNRRVMALELDNLNRQQKEKIVYGLGIAYFLLKTIFWLNRS